MTNTSEKSPFLKIAYITINDYSSKSFLDYDFFLILEGSVRILKDDQTFFLGKDDVFLFEPDYEYQVSSAGNNIILSVILDSRFFLQGRSVQNGHYICNSAADSARNYTPLRQLLAQIAYTYFDTSDILSLHLTSHAYSLLYYLNAYHYEAYPPSLIPPAGTKYQERMTTILNYIHQNYSSSITLQEAADSLHLSAPYLSSFFKQNMNENFNTYVNNVRLKHAVDELIYSRKSITAITYDNGFASMNAFNKIFKEKYETTPNRYRQKMQNERIFHDQPKDAAVQELSVAEYSHLLEDYGKPTKEFFHNIRFPFQEVIEVADMHSSVPVIPIWKQLLNVGPLSQLSKRDIEKQMNQIQESTGFSYARIEYVVNYELFLAHNAREPFYTFTDFDRAVDSFQMHHLIPYLDLSVPPEQQTVTDTGAITVDLEHYLSFLDALIKRNANMYGPDYMETWYFEINPHYHLPFGLKESPESFIRRFRQTWALLKKYLPNARVGGVCHPAILDYQDYRCILSALKESHITPDFFSIGIFPFEPYPQTQEEPSPVGVHYTRDPSFAMHKLTEFKHILSEYYTQLPKVHIAYLAPDCFQGHYLNDTCFQSTFFFHNTVDLIGEVDMLGYYQLSDIGSLKDEDIDFLESRTGLFNKYGIRKPGCHLLDIFSKARNNLVQKGTDYVVLKGSLDRYMIGLCNYSYVSEYSSFSLHNKIPVEDAYKIYESPQTKNIELKLNNLAVGDYDIILYQINKKHGSILDEWARNGYWDRFSRDELEYMRKILQPLRTHYTKSSPDGTMQFQFQLAPHEVVFIVLLQRW